MNEFILIFIGGFFGVLVGFVIADGIAIPNAIIIEKGYGLYCPDTGNFAFVGECENDNEGGY